MVLALVSLTKGPHQHWGRKTWKSIPRHINTNKGDIKLSHIWKVPTPMSTWCAAKNLFLYYRKYLSEHICNMLLWEHILGILFMQRAQVDSRLDSELWSTASLLCLLPPFPAAHSFGKLVQPDLRAFSRCLYIWLWIFLSPLWFCWKGLCFPAHRLPPASSLQHAGKSISLCQTESRAWGTLSEESASPSPFGSPRPSRTQPGTPDQ